MAILFRATLAADLFAGSCPKAVSELMRQPLYYKPDAPALVKIRPGRNRLRHRFLVPRHVQPAAAATRDLASPPFHHFEPSFGSVLHR
jgi:hypothetical protein